MDRKSKYLLWGFVFLTIAVAGWGYRTFFIERDFIVQSTTVCDPQTEICFMRCEGDVCVNDYYKKIIKNARNIPVCNETIKKCEPLICESGEIDCKIISCSSESVEEEERCTSPHEWSKED